MDSKYVNIWVTQLKKCVIPLLILELLNENHSYGYLLISMIKDCTGLIISEGTIYPILNRLYEEGLVEYKWIEQKSGIPRKYYILTDNGRSTLSEMKGYWEIIDKNI